MSGLRERTGDFRCVWVQLYGVSAGCLRDVNEARGGIDMARRVHGPQQLSLPQVCHDAIDLELCISPNCATCGCVTLVAPQTEQSSSVARSLDCLWRIVSQTPQGAFNNSPCMRTGRRGDLYGYVGPRLMKQPISQGENGRVMW